MTVHAPQAAGRMLAHQLLIRPRLRMLIKLGIMPAPNSIVNMTYFLKNDLPGTGLLSM